MKKFLWAMAGLFAVLAIVFYNKSIIKAGYGYNTMDVANMQMTVFAAASAILCGVNVVGALILSAIDSISISLDVSKTDLAKNVVNAIEQNNERKEEEIKRQNSISKSMRNKSACTTNWIAQA